MKFNKLFSQNDASSTFALWPKWCVDTKRWVWLERVYVKTTFHGWDDWEDYYYECDEVGT